MYNWRKLSAEERAFVLTQRKGRELPWHSPPHLDFAGTFTFIITAACYEHAHLIGKNVDRIAELEYELLTTCQNLNAKVYAWNVLPNHYHLLAQTADIKYLRKELGKIHGRSARFWNKEDDTLGRKVWFNFFDRDMKSDRHFWASMNYVNNNAVYHGYVGRWQDWPFSSASKFLSEFGREEAARIWQEYPILDYGKDWDIY
jgi:putative transposase